MVWPVGHTFCTNTRTRPLVSSVYSRGMGDVTRILCQIQSGDPSVADQLLPLVYNELRHLAAARLVHENPGQTLQATALVHEAYIRLVDVDETQAWNGPGHFFAAAVEPCVGSRWRTRGASMRKTVRGGELLRVALTN